MLKKLDVYQKPHEDFRVRTKSGAAISMVVVVIFVLLVLVEFGSYMQTSLSPRMVVDSELQGKLEVYVDIYFPNIPCSYLSLDAMDVNKHHQIDIRSKVVKRRYKNGVRMSENEIATELNQAKAKIALKRDPGYCGSCYGSESSPGQCCNTCEEVREAYRLKGWAFKNSDHIDQCASEGFKEELERVKDEGCEVRGTFQVNRIAGNFHFAPGKSFEHSQMHVHDLQPFPDGVDWNFAHRIRKIRFGNEASELIGPLKNVNRIGETRIGMHQYYLKIVPTELPDRPSEVSYQYSATSHFVPVTHSNHGALPGVFFNYDLSPVKVTYVDTSQSFFSFLTNLVITMGGLFAFSTFIDAFVYSFGRFTLRSGPQGLKF